MEFLPEKDAEELLVRDWTPTNRLGIWPHWFIYKPHKRLLRWFSVSEEGGAWRLLAQVAGPGVALVLSLAVSWGKLAEPAWLRWLVVLGVLGWLVALVNDWRARRGAYRIQRRVIRAVLCTLVTECFSNIDRCRATWFRVDPLSNVLVPFARYAKWEPKPVFVPDSKCYYPRGVSYTGVAWKAPGSIIPFWKEFSGKHADEDMRDYYIKTLGVPKRIVNRISGHMGETKCVLSLGVLSDQQHLLGVLSVDFMSSVPIVKSDHKATFAFASLDQKKVFERLVRDLCTHETYLQESVRQ